MLQSSAVQVIAVAVADRPGPDGPEMGPGVLDDTGIGRFFLRRTFRSAERRAAGLEPSP